jgi:large subunit ribosomal protein L29
VKASELRALDDAQLREKLAEYKVELFNLRFQKATGKLTNTSRPRQVKKEIARILTILRERELAQAELG